ncbi:MAG: outer membrane beta-barrel protein [Bacteroidales bacterium]|nr:outer membrane beta-barrel protein [Bacteroidales bacterium]
MKKIILSLMVLFSVAANAQNFYLSGSLSLWHDGDADLTTFQLVPDFGYNFNDKWAAGVELGYGHYKADGKANAFAISPYARYTFFQKGMVRLFAEGGVGFSTYKVKDGGDATNGFSIGIKPGIFIDLTEHFSLIAKYGFLGYCDDYAMIGNGLQSIGGLNFNPSTLSFGLHYEF